MILFDGTGWQYAAEVERIGRAEVELLVLSRQNVDRELPVEVTLGVSLPKGDRQRWLVEKAVELGVARIVPLKASRSVAQPVHQALARLRRTVVEASKQCGRNRLLEILEPQPWTDFAVGAPNVPHRLLAHPEGHSRPAPHTPDKPWSGPAEGAVHLAVGPEGGFVSEEVALALAVGWRPVDLGPRILRVETAAIVLVALVAQTK